MQWNNARTCKPDHEHDVWLALTNGSVIPGHWCLKRKCWITKFDYLLNDVMFWQEQIIPDHPQTNQSAYSLPFITERI